MPTGWRRFNNIDMLSDTNYHMSPGRCELLFLDEAVSRLMKPETAYLIGLAPVSCCSTVSNSYICSICSAVRAYLQCTKRGVAHQNPNRRFQKTFIAVFQIPYST